MKVRSTVEMSTKGIDFVEGDNDVPDEIWAKVQGGNRIQNLRMAGVLKWDENAAQRATQTPRPVTPATPVKVPEKATELVSTIKAAQTKTELDALGAADDTRTSVAKAYAAKLEEFGD